MTRKAIGFGTCLREKRTAKDRSINYCPICGEIV